MAAFQNLTVDYRSVLGKLSVTDRIRLLYTESGRDMLASLTAEQYAKLFPTYYKEKIPDISGFMKALTPEGRRTLVNADQLREGSYSAPGGKAPPRTELAIPSGRAKPSVLQRLEKIMDTQGISDAGAKPELSTEQKELIKKMRQGQVVSADNETAAFISKLTPEQKQQAGILDATDEAGKPAFKMAPTQVTRQEIESARRSTVSGGNNKEIIMKSFADELRKQGVPEANLPYAVAAMAGQVQGESGFNPKAVHDSGTGYGIYGARDPSPGRGRRTDMFKWLEANGYTKDSPEGQARYMVHEAFTKYPKTRGALVGANKDNIGEVTSVLVNDFERPQERAKSIRDRTQHSIGFFESATRIAENRDLAGNMTDEQIEQILKERKERGQEQALAGTQEKPKLPDGVDPRFAQLYEQMPLGQAQNAIRAIEKRGLENFNSDVKKAFEEGAEGTGTRPTGRGVGTVETPGAPGSLRPDAVGNLISMSNQRAVRNKPLSGNLTDQLNYAASMSGVKVEVFSGGQAGIGSGGPRVGSTRHDHGGAADVKLAVTDAQGRRRYLDMRNPEDAAKMESFVKHAVHAGATGVGAGYMGASTIHVGGGTSRSWGGADWIARAHTAGTQSRKDQPVDIAAWKERRQSELAAAQEQSSNVQEASDEAKKEERESAYRNIFNPERFRQAGVLGKGVGTVETPGAPGSLPQTDDQAQTEETPKIPQNYAGGEQKVNSDSITAFPISGLNGDNAIVADSNKDPLFTMNTNKESASYDPNTGKVEIQPVKRNEPEQLKNNEEVNSQTSTVNEFTTPQENQNASEMRPAPSPDPNYSLQAAIMSSANPFTTPSFERAVNAANFKKTGYHFDHGAANLR